MPRHLHAYALQVYWPEDLHDVSPFLPEPSVNLKTETHLTMSAAESGFPSPSFVRLGVLLADLSVGCGGGGSVYM